MVVATLQKDAVGETVPDFKVHAYRGNGIRQNFLVMCL